MVFDALRSVVEGPRPTGAPGPRRRDWVLVGAVVTAALAEGLLRPEVVWRPVATLAAVALACCLPWRRTHPLEVTVVTFGLIVGFDVVALVTSSQTPGLYTMAFVLLLPYALFRWGSGRDRAMGSIVIAAAVALSTVLDYTGVTDTIAGVAIVVAAAAIGLEVRTVTEARGRERSQIQLLERERLARELHDTVAHHVSAIAIQAQAGKALEPQEPGAALEALDIIERAAADTLSEMRAMVRILRTDRSAELTPIGGAKDLDQLAQRAGVQPPVAVSVTGELTDLPPAVDAAIFRVAQESVTNATRHARDATRIDIVLAVEPNQVHLTVKDDGTPDPLGTSWISGFGLVGMAERARLLGGTCEAGPQPGGGWTVSAVLPLTGSTQ